MLEFLNLTVASIWYFLDEETQTHEGNGEPHEAAHEAENSDSDVASQESKRNHEPVLQETKPRITRRHSYGK